MQAACIKQACIHFPKKAMHWNIPVLILMHSERIKLYTILAFLSAIGLQAPVLSKHILIIP